MQAAFAIMLLSHSFWCRRKLGPLVATSSHLHSLVSLSWAQRSQSSLPRPFQWPRCPLACGRPPFSASLPHAFADAVVSVSSSPLLGFSSLTPFLNLGPCSNPTVQIRLARPPVLLLLRLALQRILILMLTDILIYCPLN